jgi:hypothetical protein
MKEKCFKKGIANILCNAFFETLVNVEYKPSLAMDTS